MNVNKILLFFLKVVWMANGSRILIVFPTPAQSHYFLGNSLAMGLANKGHDVTMVSVFEQKTPPKNGTYINILLTGMQDYLKDNDLPSFIEMGNMNPAILDIKLNGFIGAGHGITEFMLKHPNFQNLIRSNEQFDVIILEQFNNDGLKILSCHYKAPLISFSTMGAGFLTNSFAGNPSPPSYIPDIFLSYTSQMNLWERTLNSLFILLRHINRYYFFLPKQGELIKEYFPQCHEDYDKIIYNVSLTFLNSHESISYPVPLVPSMIPVGGLHLNPPKKLTVDLQKFMDDAKDGVIYFSLGSNIPPSLIGTHAKEIILRVFGKLKQKILWKWDEEFVEGKPDNVKINKWFPQQDILAHPNIKLFITHGGLLSTTETLCHGVPVLSLPVFGDQKLNSAKIETDGYGLTIWMQDITEENMTDALEQLLNNSKFRENARRKSIFLHDRPVSPMDLAIYWTEYVIKYQGTPHLKVGGLDLEWYQYLLLDVIAVVVFSILSVFFTIYVTFKLLLRKYGTIIKLKRS